MSAGDTTSAARMWLFWVLLLASLVVSAVYLIDKISVNFLQRDAEQTALEYADYISSSVPELTSLLETSNADLNTIAALHSVRNLGKVFRFKLFGASGNTVLISDDLDRPDPIAHRVQESLGNHLGNLNVESIVLGGSNFIELKDGREKPDRPDMYSEAYVPLVTPNGISGVVEVYVDQTDRAATIKAAFFKVALIVSMMLFLVGAVAGYQAWKRLGERKRAESRIRYLAENDVLCDIFNRSSFEKNIEQAIWRHEEGGPAFTVLCIDLDKFKEINDTHGHSAGDDVLRQATGRMKKLINDDDVISRLGGDEFAILLSGKSDVRDVQQLGERVVVALAEPMSVGDHSLSCGASVGAARFGTDASTVSEILHQADLAMYRSKTNGRNRFSFYDSELDDALEKRRVMAVALRSALSDGGLSLYYQPLYSADANCDIVGYEALMRWNLADHGMVPPDVFIPLAEETGQIERMGKWAIQQACDDAADWPPHLHVAVNLSAIQFRAEYNLVQLITETLESSGLTGDRLEVEITESLLINNTDDVLIALNALSGMGVRIAMDDFGTGYSSLSYLWRFPFNKVKIDKAFTQGIEDDEKVPLIVSSIISLAHSLGIRVNAEGVETESQMQKLQKLGCDELQGFLLGRPQPVDNLAHQDLDKAA